MRSVYPAVFLCALACASVPSASRTTNSDTSRRTATLPAAASNSALRGHILTGSFTTEYFSGETLYDVLRRRAPTYLRPRGGSVGEFTGTADPMAVYIDGNFSGSLEVLSSIPAQDVFSVQRMGATEAAIRYGPRHGSGALLVTLVRR